MEVRQGFVQSDGNPRPPSIRDEGCGFVFIEVSLMKIPFSTFLLKAAARVSHGFAILCVSHPFTFAAPPYESAKIGARGQVGCGENPTKVQHLQISKAGVYEN